MPTTGPWRVAIAAFVGVLLAAGTAMAAGDETDWPCPGPKVERLSLAQIWRGELPAVPASSWAADREIAPLAARLARPDLPDEEVERLVREFAARQPAESRRMRLLTLLQAVFATVDGQRRRVIRRIEAFGRNQKRLVAQIVADTEALEQNEVPEPERAVVEARRDWSIRIFDDRRRMTRVVCEEPDRYERHLFTVARAIRAVLEERGEAREARS